MTFLQLYLLIGLILLINGLLSKDRMLDVKNILNGCSVSFIIFFIVMGSIVLIIGYPGYIILNLYNTFKSK